jgi:hypothetical protein
MHYVMFNCLLKRTPSVRYARHQADEQSFLIGRKPHQAHFGTALCIHTRLNNRAKKACLNPYQNALQSDVVVR